MRSSGEVRDPELKAAGWSRTGAQRSVRVSAGKNSTTREGKPKGLYEGAAGTAKSRLTADVIGTGFFRPNRLGSESNTVSGKPTTREERLRLVLGWWARAISQWCGVGNNPGDARGCRLRPRASPAPGRSLFPGENPSVRPFFASGPPFVCLGFRSFDRPHRLGQRTVGSVSGTDIPTEPGEQTFETRGEHFNLISVLYHLLHGADTCAIYALDVEGSGDAQSSTSSSGKRRRRKRGSSSGRKSCFLFDLAARPRLYGCLYGRRDCPIRPPRTDPLAWWPPPAGPGSVLHYGFTAPLMLGRRPREARRIGSGKHRVRPLPRRVRRIGDPRR